MKGHAQNCPKLSSQVSKMVENNLKSRYESIYRNMKFCLVLMGMHCTPKSPSRIKFWHDFARTYLLIYNESRKEPKMKVVSLLV